MLKEVKKFIHASQFDVSYMFIGHCMETSINLVPADILQHQHQHCSEESILVNHINNSIYVFCWLRGWFLKTCFNVLNQWTYRKHRFYFRSTFMILSLMSYFVWKRIIFVCVFLKESTRYHLIWFCCKSWPVYWSFIVVAVFFIFCCWI
jgi:hypothetical protein